MRSLPLVVALILLPLLSACDPQQQASAAPDDAGSKDERNAPMATIRLMKEDGTLSEQVEVPKLVLSDAEWKKRLTPEQYRIARSAGTERPFCSGLLENKGKGVYACVGCNLPLFTSDTKFESGTGWPSFFQPIAKENVAEKPDHSHGMTRVEVNCARCDSHLGHVFEDGPRPTGLRFCINGEVLKFVPTAELKTIAEKVPAAKAESTSKASSAGRAEAVFAGGCFWCVEAVFEELDGVIEAVSGYSGGTKESANYEAVCSGTTGHAEVVKIIYDPSKISYEKLLEVHFATHDPTTLNRQGADVGPQYRSAIFYADEREKELAKAFIDDLNESKAFKRPVVTTLEPLKAFYDAEKYHQNYACQNLNQGYIQGVALPKVQKVREKYKDLLREKSAIPELAK
jgi:peptide methionine sulfoxide reductase msrA/msrB